MYVCDKDAEQLHTHSLIAKQWHWIAEEYSEGSQLIGKIRYRQNPPVPVKIEKIENDQITFLFESPQWAVAPGQVFVLYDGERCL